MTTTSYHALDAYADDGLAPSGAQQPDAVKTPFYKDAPYTPAESNWYTAKPYGFRFTSKEGRVMVMYLPINPSNLTISTAFATSMVPTLYGTVEEHSPVRYFDISIEGTTGMGPRYVEPFEHGSVPLKDTGRTAFAVKDRTGLFGFLQNTFTKFDSVVSSTKELAKPPTLVSGIKLNHTGYMAFHNLYRFLLQYKKDTSGDNKDGNTRTPGTHPLYFFNYKDCNEYKVVVRSMTMRRDQADPMTYHYAISMRGYDLRPIGQKEEDDGRGPLLKSLGLDGVEGSSRLGDLKTKAERARGILASVGNGISQLGR